MAVPISASNKNAVRSLSQQHYGTLERGLGGAQSSRKMSDSFFSSLFSTRHHHHRKSNAIGETTARSNYELSKSTQNYESPKFQRKNATAATAIADENLHGAFSKMSVAAKPPSGKQQKYYSATPPTALQSEECNMGKASEIRLNGPSTSSSLQHFGSRRMNGRGVEKEQKTVTNISASPPSLPIVQQRLPRQPQRTKFSSFIRRSLSRTRRRSPSSEQSSMKKTMELDSSEEVAQRQRSISGVLAAVENVSSPQAPQQLSFAQRIKLHKGLRTGNIPVELLSQKVLLQKEQQEKRQQKAAAKIKEEITTRQGTNKAFSADAINEIDATSYLTEALLAIADSQPVVARSTPKHDPKLDTTYGAMGACSNTEYYRNKRRADERLRRDCIFEPEFYDQMLSDSLEVCALLQTHLTDCIDGVRARSPTALSSPFNSPPATPILTRSQSTQPYQQSKNAFGLSASLSPPPPIVPQHLQNGFSTSSPSPARSVWNDHNSYPPSPTQTMKYLHYTRPGDKSITATSQQHTSQKYSYYSGLGAASTSTPRVRISVSGGMARFPIRRQNSTGENTNYSSSNYSASNYSVSPQMNGGSPAYSSGMYASSVPLLGAASLPPIPNPPHSNYPQRRKFPTNVHFAA